jgi:lipopolysaccharide transport system permease protein
LTAVGGDVERSRSAWTRRLLKPWISREVRALYRQSALDIGWSILSPVLTVIGFGFVLTQAFGVDGDGVPYLVFAWTGVVLWTFVAGGLVSAANSLVAASELVRKVYFPREVVPISAVAVVGLDLVAGVAALLVLMVVQGVGFSITAVAAVPILGITILWTVAAGVLLATVTAFVRDLAHGVPIVLRIGIIVTPVMYPASLIPEGYRWIVAVNPVAVFIEGLRDALLRHVWPDWWLLAAHGVAAVGLLVLSLWYVQRVEGRMADVI